MRAVPARRNRERIVGTRDGRWIYRCDVELGMGSLPIADKEKARCSRARRPRRQHVVASRDRIIYNPRPVIAIQSARALYSVHSRTKTMRAHERENKGTKCQQARMIN